MWAVAGLGNPGRKYSGTRHNAGFMALELLAERFRIGLADKGGKYMFGKGSIEGETSLLIEPLTYMNRSGHAVREVLKYHDVPAGNLIVIHDDIDIPPGRLRIRSGGSSGGHRGVQSIIEQLGTQDFIRIKVGVGRDEQMLAEDYVLKKFSKSELPIIEECIHGAVDAVSAIIRDGVDSAMNTFNKKSDIS